MSKVFVSYKRDEDKNKVLSIVKDMESKLGIKFWVDLEGIESYDQFSKRIIKAINECEVFLFMYSKAHENIDPEKDWTVKELNFAYEKRKRIVWIELEECSLYDWFLFKFPDKQVVKVNDESAMKKLTEDIRILLHLTQSNNQGKTIDTKDIHIRRPNRQSETSEAINPHPQAIDLGLPSGTKWASCNVDDDPSKQSPTNYGSYYAWGETEAKSIYDCSTYKHCDGSWDTCHNLGSDIAGTKYDVAHMKWGGNWRMPTFEQIKELLKNCTSKRTEVNGVKGRKFTSKINGNSIFLPAAGYRWSGGLGHAGSNYWSSTQYPSYSLNAYYLYFNSGNAGWSHNARNDGHAVRPVSRI